MAPPWIVSMGTDPFDTFWVANGSELGFGVISACSRSGHFTVKNNAVLIEVGSEGARFDRGRFLDENALSSREKRSRKSLFSPHPTRFSRRFSSARSNARSQADIRPSLGPEPASYIQSVK